MTRAELATAQAVAAGRMEIADAWYDASVVYCRPEPRAQAVRMRESIQAEVDDIECEIAALDQADDERGAA